MAKFKDLGRSASQAWPMHFRKLCSHWKVKQREGVDAQTFAEMLEETMGTWGQTLWCHPWLENLFFMVMNFFSIEKLGNS